ncbi:MAG: RNA 3'-terminal phosphate cyclase [Hyphomicrobiaceae bacterium]|nr:RNA 3'-terminal phosphate cyclase [Hyphomicrobiaceae bacterium]
MLILDGSYGEGGGQILRTSLTLSMITGEPFRIERIRAKRRKPGLLRQHLTAVRAAARIANARVKGDEPGSTALTFEPGVITAGDYDIAIGTAGSTTLVFQTVLPALLRADAPSRLKLSGGTHNPSAPTFDYLARAYLPLLHRMGASVEVKLHRPGFYPAGGGTWSATVQPSPLLEPLMLHEAGPVNARRITADVANLPFEIAEREAAIVTRMLSWPQSAAHARDVGADGHGNVLAIEIVQANITEIFTGFGSRDLSAEAVADATAREARAYIAASVPVGPHLADQLLLPLALAGTGSFVTVAPTMHTRTNIEVIEKFLPLSFSVDEIGSGRWRIALAE